MESKIPVHLADVKTDTERIHAVLLQIVNSQAECSCKDKITGIKKDLDALKEKLSTREEECRQVRKKRDDVKSARARQLEEASTHLEHIQNSLRTVKLNKPLGTIAGGEYAESMRSTESGTAVSDIGASTPLEKPEPPTNRVCVKRQSERRNSMDAEKWKLLGRQEVERVSLTSQPSGGYHTVLLLDISESMATEDSWSKVKTFVNDFLSGLEEHSGLYQPSRHVDEHVSLVTFGHQTHVEIPMTKDFKVIRNKIDDIEFGGPSPLVGGLLVAREVLLSLSVQNPPACINNVSLHHKVIVLTDGQPTGMSLYCGPDLVDETNFDEDMANLVWILDTLNDAKMSVFFVEVPNGATTFFSCIQLDDPYRNVFDCNDGRRLARRNYLCTKTVNDEQFGDLEISDGNLTAADRADMCDIVTTTHTHVADAMAATERRSHGMYRESNCTTLPIIGSPVRRGPDWKWDYQDSNGVGTVVGHWDNGMDIAIVTERRSHGMYLESNCKTLPIIGSRVRRGPDWKWDYQDSNGVGTVVGHWDNETCVTVEWDAKLPRGNLGYRYGAGFFDLLIVDEVRSLKPGELMAVGCQVKTGRQGKFSNVHAWNKGVVIEMKPPKARVRWDSGIRGDYSYGEDGRFEIEIWESAKPETTLKESDKPAPGSKSKNKNKLSK